MSYSVVHGKRFILDVVQECDVDEMLEVDSDTNVNH